jgi:cytochrome P450
MPTTARRSVPLLGDLLAFRRDRLDFLTTLARDHGDIATFRLGPYRVHQLSHPDLVQEALVAGAHRLRKGPVLQRAKLVLGEGLLTAEGEHHRRSRRRLQSAFHPRRIEGYATTMVATAATRSARWSVGRPLDVHREMVRITLATAGATLLGADVAREDDVQRVEDAIADLLSAYKLGFVPFGWRLQHLPIGPPRRLRRGRASLYELIDRTVAQRRSSGQDRGDLLSALVLAEGEERMSDVEIREQALTLLLAGHETTANALAFALHLLAGNPEVEARVHAEVDEVLDGRMPTADDIPRLTRCRGVIAEALRLYPPSWAMSRQAVEDHDIAGHPVAAGELVLCPQWVVHRDPRWWDDPHRCVLDRWLPGADPARPRWAFFPFGAGSRRCLGEGFAWTEGILVLATVASRWRLRPVPQAPVELEPLITLRPRAGLWLQPEPREVTARVPPG